MPKFARTIASLIVFLLLFSFQNFVARHAGAYVFDADNNRLEAFSQQYRTVKRVVDGDTVVLENGESVRLIGVDTPETKDARKPVEYFGREATAFTKQLVEGKRVRLEFDQANAHRRHKDATRQRRTLAYLFLEDGTFLNAEIIKHGYGFAYTRFPFKYLDEFRRLELEAREQERGLWKKDKAMLRRQNGAIR